MKKLVDVFKKSNSLFCLLFVLGLLVVVGYFIKEKIICFPNGWLTSRLGLCCGTAIPSPGNKYTCVPTLQEGMAY